MSTAYAKYSGLSGGGSAPASGNLTDVGTDGIVITGGTGAVLGSGTSLAQHVADTTHNGYLSSTDWNTFNNKQSTLTLGNLTDAGTDGITVTGGTGAVVGSGTSIAQHVADTTHNGYLSSTDWNTFNGKQAALTLTNLTDTGTDGITVTNGTGAVIGASPVTLAQHVADTTHNGYLSSTDWNTFNGKGAGSVTSVAMTVPTFLSISGSPITGSGTLAVTLSGTALPLANGGTGQTTKAAAFDALSPMTTGGDIIYGGASGTGTRLANGSAGQVLTSAGTTLAPTWATPTTGTVTAVSVASANGFAGSSSGGATPALTLSTSITGVLKGNGTAISAATAGTDYGTAKQNVVGTAQTSDTTVTSATYAAFASSVTVTLTATNTATYKIYCTATVFDPSSATLGLKIITTGGNVPTTVFVQEAIFDTISTTNTRQTASLYSLYTLTSGTAYTFTLQGKASAGTLTLNASTNGSGIALVAEQVTN